MICDRPSHPIPSSWITCTTILAKYPSIRWKSCSSSSKNRATAFLISAKIFLPGTTARNRPGHARVEGTGADGICGYRHQQGETHVRLSFYTGVYPEAGRKDCH